MATISYRIKKQEKNTKNVREKASIRVRVNQLEKSTGIIVHRKYWSDSKQKVKNTIGADYADAVNNKLNELNTHLSKELAYAQLNDLSITQVWLSDSINSFFNKATSNQTYADIYFSDFILKYTERKKDSINRQTGKSLTKKTIKNYISKRNRIVEFENYTGKRLKIYDVNMNFYYLFLDFMRDEYAITNPNTIGDYIDVYKQVCRDAKRRGLKVSSDIESPDFYAPTKRTSDFALKEKEIDKIFNYDFSKNERLDNARDWFIIGIWTGLRISDFLKLNKSFIDDEFITITNQKTDIPVIIPLHDQTISVLEKRKGKFPRKISNQNFNKYIKEICKLIGMTDKIEGAKMIPIKLRNKTVSRKKTGKYPKYELISSHICRRTFATIHYGKLDTLAIMKITGHKTEKQFIEYVRLPPKIYAERLKAVWKAKKEGEKLLLKN